MLEHLLVTSKNRSVALFPEGTRTRDGKIHPFFRGFIYLFRSRDMDILPVTSYGFYNLKPKNKSYINFGSKLNVIIHKPISKKKLLNMNDSQIIDTVKTVIESSYQDFTEEVSFHVDGELNFSKKFNVKALPDALKIIYNPEGHHFFKRY